MITRLRKWLCGDGDAETPETPEPKGEVINLPTRMIGSAGEQFEVEVPIIKSPDPDTLFELAYDEFSFTALVSMNYKSSEILWLPQFNPWMLEKGVPFVCLAEWAPMRINFLTTAWTRGRRITITTFRMNLKRTL